MTTKCVLNMIIIIVISILGLSFTHPYNGATEQLAASSIVHDGRMAGTHHIGTRYIVLIWILYYFSTMYILYA